MSSDERFENLLATVRLLVEHGRSVEGQMDDLREAQANSEARIAALADAQIRTEESFARFHESTEHKLAALADAQIRTEGVMGRLAERMSEMSSAQAHTDTRLDALLDFVRKRSGDLS